MGLLADIYSGGNTLKRRLNALIADPAGTINTGVIRAREDNNKLLNLFANAYPMAGDRTVLNSPEQIAQFQREAADKAGEMGLAGATVWHGSPHKFDKFDSSKIGTGEGAQAYGHGLYLAESPDVARGYKDKLEAGRGIGDDDTIARLLNALGGDTSKAAAEFERRAQYSNIPGGKERLLGLAERVRGGADPRGSLYKVDLPDEHIAKMLDWDKPLSQQHSDVQAAFKSKLTPEGVKADPPGSSLYNSMLGPWDKQHIASDQLFDAGIPGIRYLDGGSRGAGAGSSNFVVFPGNEGLLNILERNGQPVNQLKKLMK